MTKPPEIKLPSCPGFCILPIMAAFCERPKIIISRTSTCPVGQVCCGSTKSSVSCFIFIKKIVIKTKVLLILKIYFHLNFD